jgi:hypothetical protein
MSITLANAHHLIIIFSNPFSVKIVYNYGHRVCSVASFWQFHLLVNSKCIRSTVINKITHGRPCKYFRRPKPSLFEEKYYLFLVYFEVNYNFYCILLIFNVLFSRV